MNSPTDTAAVPSGQTGAASRRVADATPRNWVDRFAPAATRPYLRLSRADRPAGTWLLLLPCWFSLTLAAAADRWTATTVWVGLACAVGAFLMRGAGCTWNDVADWRFDAQVARTRSRPIPSGQVGVRQALAWGVAQALLAFAVLLSFNAYAIWVGVASLGFVAIYPFMKRFTWWPQVFLGLAFNWGAWMGWAGHFGALGPAPALLYLGGVFWTLHYDTIYAHQDRADDELIGVRSTARLFGSATEAWLRAFAGLSALCMAAAAAVALSGAALAVALAGVAAFGWDLRRQIRALDIDDPDLCLRLFRANRDSGLILVAGFAAASLV